MPPLAKEALRQILLESLAASGLEVLDSSDDHPFRVVVLGPQGPESFRVYIWNVTHGGATRAEDEQRIQITGVERLEFTEGMRTVLLGLAWVDDQPIFVAFDPTRHAVFGASPSIQFRQGTLTRALEEELAFESKQVAGGNVEVVVAFMPESFEQYLFEIQPAYHAPGSVVGEVEGAALDAIAFRMLTDQELGEVPDRRRRVLRQVSADIRDRRFRRKVLQVYEHRCALCGLQGDLVEGCHIKGFAEEGPDDVRNGIALCYLCHKAYDRYLVAIDGDYTIRLNRNRDRSLRDDGRSGGLDEMYARMRIGQRVYLPQDGRFQPNPEQLAANLARKGRENFT